MNILREFGLQGWLGRIAPIIIPRDVHCYDIDEEFMLKMRKMMRLETRGNLQAIFYIGQIF
jgi:hypothetical protein